MNQTTPRTHTRTYRRRRTNTGLSLPSVLTMAVGLGVVALLVVLFPLDWVRAPTVNMTTDQTIFSPNGDGQLDVVTVFFDLSQPANVTAEVLNSVGQRVRTLMNEQPLQAGQHSFAWDGRDEGGFIVPDGTYRLRIVAAGTMRSSEESEPVTVDTTPPPLVLANIDKEIVTRETSFTLEGTTSPDALVWLNDEPQPIAVNPNGVFRVVRQLPEGTTTFTVRAVDLAGNTATSTFDVTVRTTPPDVTILEPQPEAWLNTNPVTVRGQAQPGAIVTVNGKEVPVSEDGTFQVDVVLEEGDNAIIVEARDEVGNVSHLEQIVHLRTQGPTITLTNLTDGLEVSSPTLRIAGQVDPGASLLINGQEVPVDSRGNFSALLTFAEGDNLITLSATDRAGNTTTIQRMVRYTPAGTTGNTPLASLNLPNNVLAQRVLMGLALLVPFFLLIVYWMRPLHFSLSVENPVFYPNRPDDSRLLVMNLDLSRPARVTIRVYDQMDNLVATLVEKRKHRRGDHFRLWDGRDEYGNVLPSGSYLVEATADTRFTTVTSAVWVYVDATPVMLGTVSQQTDRQEHAYVEGEIVDADV
nr:FlgD immunoglobulin-like domain containing protein [Ardenticatena sp.]